MTPQLPWRARPHPPYKLLSVLLQYPGDDVIEAEEELAAAVADLSKGPCQRAVIAFWQAWVANPPLARAERYVATFDLHKRTSLYLTFYLHGDTRKRGMALLRLKQAYTAAGFPMAARELPDYLPVLLEFAALAPEPGETLLAEHRPELEVLRGSLREQASPYQHLLDAVCLGLRPLTSPEVERLHTLAAEGPPRERVGLEPFAPPEVLPAGEARL